MGLYADIQSYKQSLVDLTNKSKLAPAVLELVLSDTLRQVQTLAIQLDSHEVPITATQEVNDV